MPELNKLDYYRLSNGYNATHNITNTHSIYTTVAIGMSVQVAGY